MVSSEDCKKKYVLSGGTVYAFALPFFQASDIVCYLYNPDDNTEQTLVRTRDYSVEAKDDYSGGADITLITGGSTSVFAEGIPEGQTLSIVRELAYTQGTSLPLHGKLPSTSLEKQMDNLEMQIQQLKEGISRAMVVAHGSTVTPEVSLVETAIEASSASIAASTAALAASTASSASAAAAAVSAAEAAASAASVKTPVGNYSVLSFGFQEARLPSGGTITITGGNINVWNSSEGSFDEIEVPTTTVNVGSGDTIIFLDVQFGTATYKTNGTRDDSAPVIALKVDSDGTWKCLLNQHPVIIV